MSESGLLDTSVFIAQEQGRSVRALPEDGAVSVVTLAELQLGVLAAPDDDARAARLQTVSRLEHEFEPLGIDSEIARTFAALVHAARRSGRQPKAMGAWIAATAVTLGLPLYTQDRDFRAFGDRLRVVEV
ncbi:MAG: PIN domain-containing protein [Acidimicrobiia bacterium]